MRDFGLGVMAFLLLNLCWWAFSHQDPKPVLEQEYMLRATAYANAGPCLNHKGRHVALFLKSNGSIYGSISPELAHDGDEVKVFYGKSDGKQYISINKGRLQLEPPEGE